jgi:hypothetical protein
MVRSKGVTAFGVIFIVLSILTFIGGVGSLISNILNAAGLMTDYLSSTPSIYDWIISVVGIIGGVILFFAGLFIIKNKASSIKILSFASVVFIFHAILKIVESFREIFTSENGGFAVITGSTSIAFNIFVVLFWIYVMWFFSRQKIKNQLTL